MGPATDNVIDEAWAVVAAFVVQYGWYLIFLGCLVYYLTPHATRVVNRMSLEHANRPARRNILDSDVKRARMLQQLDVYKSNKRHRDGDIEQNEDYDSGKAN
jgi:hypothetical protein